MACAFGKRLLHPSELRIPVIYTQVCNCELEFSFFLRLVEIIQAPLGLAKT